MTAEEAVIERLLGLAAVTALVETRVYQLRLPQGATLPAVRVQQISEDEPYHLRGIVNASMARVQIDAYAAESSGGDPYATATALADAIAGDWRTGTPPNGLSGWQGTVGGSPPTAAVRFAERLTRQVMYEGDELRLVRVSQDYRLHWQRL